MLARKTAALLNQPFYSTGRPCVHGHLAQRRTQNGYCVRCEQIRYETSRRDIIPQERKAWNAGARKLAKQAGETRYRTGKPCINGHLGDRLVSNGRCAQCMYDWRTAWYSEKPEKRKAAQSRRSSTVKADPRQRLMALLRVRLARHLRGYIASKRRCGSAVRDVGCSIDELKIYLETKFQPGMTWENWSIDGWHIDHIKPLSSFDLSDREQLLKACHFTNLQPLWAIDNMRKNDAYT
jgi:hypothetical protein